MNKKKLLLLPVLLLLLSACGGGSKDSKPSIVDDDSSGQKQDQKTLASIEISATPTKLTYELNEEFDSTGLEVKAVYSDDTKEVVTDYQLSSPDMTTAGTKAVTVTYQGKTASFNIVVNPEAVAPVAMTEGVQADAVSHPGTWIYWADTNWCGSKVTASKAETLSGDVDVAYTVNNGACTFGFQLFYKDPTLQSGVKYKQTFKITSALAVEVEFINAKIQLEAGVETSVEIHYWQTDDISFKAVFPVSEGQTNTVQITDIANEVSKVLDAPLNVSVSEDFKISFTEAQHATSYQVKVEDKNGNVIEGFEAKTVTKGEVVEGLSSLPTGEYKLYVRSLADGFVTSEWTANAVTVVIGDVVLDPFSKYNADNKAFEFGEAGTAVGDPGSLYYWNAHAEWNVGGVVGVSKAEYSEGTITIAYTGSGNCAFGLQVFFKNPYLSATQKYTLSFDLNVVAAGKIGINDSGADKIDVVAGVNHMSRQYIEASDACSLSLQIPSSMVVDGAGTVTISNIVWTPAE